MSNAEPKVHLAFRFHTNFYHSYRGDTPDEDGFGVDIRVIRHTLKILDRWNASGVPVKGTWDIDNAFTLEDMMPRACPDIITALQRRTQDAQDEINVMVYNNGIISAHTAQEFEVAISRALRNEKGSGLCDIFTTIAPLVRPQEMMFTPLHLKLYPAFGLQAISLFYSAVPFNSFSTFIKPLPFVERYNPLWLSYPGIEETMALLPAYNHGDIADWLSLRRWIKTLHKTQLRMSEPGDVLLLIDADADDEYWVGFDIPILKQVLPITDGLDGLIRSVADLPYVVFTTPYAYLEEHPPIGSVCFGQDTADGSFDGYASWADKWSNHQLWTGIERSRILELQAIRLARACQDTLVTSKVKPHLETANAARLRSLSTTHFGLTAPILNQRRLHGAANLVSQAVGEAKTAFELVHTSLSASSDTRAHFSLYDYVRGISTSNITYKARPSRALLQLPIGNAIDPALDESTPIALMDEAGEVHPACIYADENRTHLIFVAEMENEQHKSYSVIRPSTEANVISKRKPVRATQNHLSNQWLTLNFDHGYNLNSFRYNGFEYADGRFVNSAVNYAGNMTSAKNWKVLNCHTLAGGLVGYIRLQAEIHIKKPGTTSATVERTFLLTANLPYLYLTTKVNYPYTASRNYNRKIAHRLGRRYDNNWREVMPCELHPLLTGSSEQCIRIWKHNYLDHISYYDLNYGQFSKNNVLDSMNNHITHGWMAVTDRKRGLLLAHTADALANFAFCPIRVRQTREGTRLYLNPFGSYYGKQWHYPTAKTGFGRWIATKMAPTLGPQAGSYNGQSETIKLLIAPYLGDQPDNDLCADAEAFAYPYALVNHAPFLGSPPYRSWQFPDG